MKKKYIQPLMVSMTIGSMDIIATSLNTLDLLQPWEQDVDWDLEIG